MKSLTNSMGICHFMSGLNTTFPAVVFRKAFVTLDSQHHSDF